MANEERLIDANYFVNKGIRNCPIEEGGIPLRDFHQHQKILALYPTVDAVEVKHGHWECEHETWGRLQCSNCKKEALLEKSNGDVGTILLYVTSNYCPNCGAKMDGEAV